MCLLAQECMSDLVVCVQEQFFPLMLLIWADSREICRHHLFLTSVWCIRSLTENGPHLLTQQELFRRNEHCDLRWPYRVLCDSSHLTICCDSAGMVSSGEINLFFSSWCSWTITCITVTVQQALTCTKVWYFPETSIQCCYVWHKHCSLAKLIWIAMVMWQVFRKL